MFLTFVAFVVAIGVLVAVHEYGHYRMAVACGVRVRRFSVGFGKVLWRWTPARQKPGQATEFVIGAIPFGGYVKMLDEREGAVDAAERHLAFNTQPLRSRALIVAAGPVANLLLAVALYAAVNWIGVQQPRAILSSPMAGSLAEKAGLQGREEVLRAGLDGAQPAPLASFEELRWLLTQGALDGRDVTLVLAPHHASNAAAGLSVSLPLSALQTADVDVRLFERIGIVSPWMRPVLEEVMPASVAEKAGLRSGDLVLQMGATPIVDAQQLRARIRQSGGVTQVWRVERGGQRLDVSVTPEAAQEKGQTDGRATGQSIGKIGAYIGQPPAMTLVRKGFVQGLVKAVEKCWDVSRLTVSMFGKMLIGQASIKNISGPLTIADYAGKSANLGLTQYLIFLALVSVSLGVLNLLPLPVLDGGHLMYYLWEAVTGKPPSERWMEILQRGGIALLLLLMSVALFNDVTRLFGQ